MAVLPCRLQVAWLVCWQAGGLVDQLGALGSRIKRGGGLFRGMGGGGLREGLLLPVHLDVSGVVWSSRLFVFTSCCSAVSLPRRSCPHPGPCGSRVWGSESCGCSGSRPLWPEPSRDPPACSGNWNHPNQRRGGGGWPGQKTQLGQQQQNTSGNFFRSSSVIRKSPLSRIKHRFGPFFTSEWKFKLRQVRGQSKLKKNLELHSLENLEINHKIIVECAEIVQNQCF